MRAKKIDINQTAIVEGLRKCGFAVAITSMVGDGFSDLVVSRAKKTKLVEVKDPNQPPSKRKLTKEQVKFHARWKDDIIIAETIEDILNNF